MRNKVAKLIWLVFIGVLVGLKVWEPSLPKPDSRPGKPLKAYAVLGPSQLIEHKDNDGDSFMIRHDGQEHVFRLYFADCPEKRRHRYNGDRLKEQGAYFGGLDERQTVAIGQEAKAFAEELLRTRRFTVHTRWQPVYDSGRYYAFVIFDDREDLSEKLVRAGLCRIHTSGSQHPDGRSEDAFRQHLRQAEHEARRVGRGAWEFVLQRS
jgi:endonuclease YncB( thermonuclease family)